MKPSAFVGPGKAQIPETQVHLFQDWYVRDGEWYPEVAVPLRQAFAIPDARNGVPGQRNQSLFVEVYVPHRTPAGAYRGRLEISAEGVKPFVVPVELQVLDFALPDRLSFDVDLNSYGPPGDAAQELRYHRLAHEHRTTLSTVGYTQSGSGHPGFAPPLTGTGQAMRVSDWTEWDRRFGRYFDGSAFADLPRAGVPLRHVYLPFQEAWPADLRKHYRFTPQTTGWPEQLIEHALKAPPVEEAFDAEYREGFQTVVRDFARHCRERGWKETEFQFYLNNKYNYRDPKQGGRGSSWWLLDEPASRDDWLALRFFGQLFHTSVREALGPPRPNDPKLIFRADVSRPQWQRDWLDGVVDRMCVSGEFFRKHDLCMDMKRTQGISFWHYGTGNDIHATNLTGEAWALQVYLAGGDGLLPWNSVEGDAAFEKPMPTALLYPGARFGIEGPLASLRLKALRRGQQDVEYLSLLAKKRSWSTGQLAAATTPLLSLEARTREQFAEDAGTTQFENVTSEQLRSLRASVAAALVK